ncbi:39S ribosomal protein L12, mitochondrial-like isoform X2 [Portunus trituberculatus]|uniref:39S ribosomal protein L12, mitochondrial-like isoform X2 n=1 Tax=Portunus trituberculatus TaxID=210409 RepID=UPI001E1D1E73|nr:39S ribosomal protein L12, mitochondrial-like isoform X2 [Portunus trituberculatus]
MQALRSVSAAGPGVLTCCLRQAVWRGASAGQQLRWRSAEALSVPAADGVPKVYPEKIQNIVTDISKLTLIEVADLNELLKKTLNIPDAPVMAFGAPMGAPAAAKDAEEEEEEAAAPAKVQTSFTLKMNKFDETKKVALIKEVKAKLEGFNLVQAKKFVESCPCVVKSDIPKDEAEALLEAFKAVGAECVIE